MKIAVVGASNDRSKFGNKIVRDLHRKGHEVFPVNPKEDVIEGMKCYHRLDELPEGMDVINIVTPPDITLKILKDANDIGLKDVWCQPGSSNEVVKSYLNANGFRYIVDSCIMLN